MSYSQNAEDEIINGIFGDHMGNLLDIGAWDPVSLSNSRLLIEKGWSAVLVEFSPAAVRNLVQQYGSRPDKIQILQAAATVGDHGTLASFSITDDGLSAEKPHPKWAEVGGFFGRLWVPRLSLSHLLCQFGGGHDFVSIDTEGTSVDLAINLLTTLAQRPKVIIVEHDDRVAELLQATQPFGYRLVHCNAENALLQLGE